MANKLERLPQAVIEHQIEAILLEEQLQQEWMITRHERHADRLERARTELLEANMAAVRAWFADELDLEGLEVAA